MKTAMVSVLSLGGTNSPTMKSSPAVLSAVDAYATRVLQSMSPPEAYIDTSLGPYVTSILRTLEITDKEEVTRIAEFDSLLELLEDQCNMEQDVATNALKEIANAVCTGAVPNDSPNEMHSIALYPIGGLDSFHASVGTPGYQGRYDRQASIDPYTPNSAGGPSPLKPGDLIPVDLLGALDDPSPHMSRYRQHQEPPQLVQEQKDEISKTDESFPPLGASTSAPPKKGGRGKKGAKSHHDKELAAALFRPARPRQNSIENEDAASTKATMTSKNRIPAVGANNRYFQQQWDSAVEILLSMNPELSEEAAAEASLMANTDFNLAQYIIDAAMSAPPVCRHMLHDGCYRSDCQFSHDVDGHTCLFWLRGRCGKGKSCKFLHGFNEKILAGIQVDSQVSQISESVPIVGTSSSTSSSNQFTSFHPSSAPSSDGFMGYPTASNGFDTKGYDNSRLGSSWQSPSLLQPSISSSYQSGDSRSGQASSFANIASRGMEKAQFSAGPESSGSSSVSSAPTVRIPQDLWNPHENRDSSVFHIPDPLERYYKVSASVTRRDVVDLHFQSTKTFSAVLAAILPGKLAELEEVWIVTGTGHHVGSKTHQKGGGALERAVIAWLAEEGYNFAKGRDRNGLGGALLVKR